MARRLDNLARRQLPYAAATALNDTAKVAANSVRKELPRIFDRPTPFTMNAISMTRATKGRLQARVFVKDRRAEYLEVQETGGTRTPEKRAIVLPRAIRTNQYGNTARGTFAAAKARKGVSSAVIDGVAGLYQRTKGKLKLLAFYTTKATYKPRFGFKRRVTKVAASVLPVAFRQSLAKALATARR
ncbi:hypothetical protein [Teichococcus aestuarii]|uniref:hypothetical protein n=1 Tax=Teichococcus aestuarii TaxID=568898 RepID=UPI003620FFCE